MAGANPQRTSWTSEEVKGDLTPEWYRTFSAYISQRVQPIAANGLIYIAAADGLHALDATEGQERWFYPTDLPPGHSPTIFNGAAYLGAYDHKLHAVDALNGRGLWVFKASAGFSTNPLVIDLGQKAGVMVFVGNRDGSLYALRAADGSFAWRFDTGGPVLYSAAYQDGVLYFASNDNFAYALHAESGEMIWKSAKLPGHGFHSWWPVIYGDYVIFSGSYNYRYNDPAPGPHIKLEREAVFPANASKNDPIGLVGQEPDGWAEGTTTLNASASAHFFETNPQRRTVFILRRDSGQELTFDADSDGLPEYAPILWFGTHSGTRYPPMVAADQVLYQSNVLRYDPYIPRGRVSGWNVGTPFVSEPKASDTAVDEPLAYSGGGNLIYYKRCCDRLAGAFEVQASSKSTAELKDWIYFNEGGQSLRKAVPGLFGHGWGFAYWKHGDPSPPIPYQGRVYMILNNALVAFAPQEQVKGKVVDAGVEVLTPPPDWWVDNGSQGQMSGEREKASFGDQRMSGLNTQITNSAGGWPRLMMQETYYSLDTTQQASARWFQLAQVASEPDEPGDWQVSDQGITRQVITRLSSGGTLTTFVSQRSPATLFQNAAASYRIEAEVTGWAYASASGVQVSAGEGEIAGSNLSEGWLILWASTDNHRWSPFVVSLQRKPDTVSFSPDGVTLTFSGAAGYLAITPLYGMSAPHSNEEYSWMNGLPQATQDRVRLIDRMARAFPSSVTESLSVNGPQNDASLSFQYSFIEFPGDWGTSPLKIAYLPTTLALAAWNAPNTAPSPIRINGQPFSSLLDLQYLTPLGRIAGLPDSTSATLTLPGFGSYWRSDFSQPAPPSPGDPLYERLLSEIHKILATGHLLPGYGITGIWESKAHHRIGDALNDYWHNPADTVYTLLLALPSLPADLQNQVKSYLQSEFQSYPLYNTAHVGWNNGASRDFFDLPPEVVSAGQSFGPLSRTDFNGWGLPPQNLYALWQYAQTFGNAPALFQQAQTQFDEEPQFETSFPYTLNSAIAGYIGYLKLAALAGQGDQPQATRTLVDLLAMRIALSKYPAALQETGFEYGGYQWTLRRYAPDQKDTLFNATVSGSLWSQMPLYGFPIDLKYGRSGAQTGGDYAFAIDFVGLTPEIAHLLQTFAPSDAAAQIESYAQRAPYWFVAEAEEAGGEGVFQPLYDRAAYFQARALIQGASRGELEQFLDVPAVDTGDLFFIQNLIFVLQAP